MNLNKNETQKECIIILISTITIFVFSLFFGAYLGDELFNPEEIELVKKNTAEIFINNFNVVVTNLIGIVFLGIPNIISCILSGFYLGIAISSTCNKFGMAWTISSFTPHSIFEIPVIIITSSYGALPWIMIISMIKKKHNLKKKASIYLKIILLTLLVSIPLLLLAAYIESHISMNY